MKPVLNDVSGGAQSHGPEGRQMTDDHGQRPRRSLFSSAFLTPARAMVISYLAVILAGGLVLTLPFCGADARISFIDALFTSTSAVCVTGLVVVDTSIAFSRLGQWVIMVLIQLGGLGILTFSTWILILARQPLGEFKRESAGYGTLSGLPLKTVLAAVFIFTFVLEAIGWIAIKLSWGDHFGDDANFQSLFHSISAFCNAGFSTIEGGMVPYRGNWGINLSISTLVILGGIGFVVMDDLALWATGKRKRLTLHTKVALQMSGMLLAAGTSLFLVLEWRHSLAGLPLTEKLMTSFFQSMTARTAGFNTVDTGALISSTLFVVMLLMIVGASPGSTGGGIKTTTFTILLALLRSQAYGRSEVELKQRSIPSADVARALTTVSLYGLTLVIGTLLLLVAQGWARPTVMGQEGFLKILFECISALSTVGLSMNYTTELTTAGKLIIIVMMFCGRLGPLVAVLAIVGQRRRAHYAYAEESLLTG